ncbi:MAG: ABC transporter substrate-binding protein [Firmicutes bacterium]|nr:ABC transporter substrate-binding protein [Bacillota bacterium]
MELDFATEFAVDYYEDGYKLITLGDGSRFLVVPEGHEAPAGIAADITPLYQPIENIYLAATASMCLFDALDSLSAIRLSGSRADAWYIENAKRAMEEGRILFAGKYSEPDYEMILNNNCHLAIESTMIGHASEVKEKLEELGLAVLVDQSSNESHPLGRTEWIKLYAALLNKEDTARQLFAEQKDYINETNTESTGKTVVFFHISSSGYVVARKSGDYVSKMIELAGGTYAFDNLGDPETNASTVNLEMETFFATAKNADVVIYNSTIGGEIQTLDDLIDKNKILAELKAVKNGDVWCTNQNMYQETTQLGKMIESFHLIFSGEADDLMEVPYLYRLR